MSENPSDNHEDTASETPVDVFTHDEPTPETHVDTSSEPLPEEIIEAILDELVPEPVPETPAEPVPETPAEPVPETEEETPAEPVPETEEETPAEPVPEPVPETEEETPAEAPSDPSTDSPDEFSPDTDIVDTEVPTSNDPVDTTPDTPEDSPVDTTEDTPEDSPVDTTPDTPSDPEADVTDDVPVDVPTNEEASIVDDDDTVAVFNEEDTIPAPTNQPEPQMGEIYPEENITFSVDNPAPQTPNLVFIVPYRNRKQQYEFFSNHMKVILEDLPTNSYRILYIHQQDQREFNRGAMKNIGFITVKNLYPDDYQNITLVFNDIDIMPYTKNFLNYFTVPGIVKHFYGFTFTLGGIVSITAGDFEKVNGFPNFWAWGYEDNMLQKRVTNLGLRISREQFYPILSQEMLHFSEGITRNINRSEYDMYQSNTTEGISTISNIQQNIEDETGFVNITYFYTSREENASNKIVYDLRNGATPFTSNMKITGLMNNKYRKPAAMRMML